MASAPLDRALATFAGPARAAAIPSYGSFSRSAFRSRCCRMGPFQLLSERGSCGKRNVGESAS